jgi:hypothetical protein
MKTKHTFRFFAGFFLVLLLAGCTNKEDMVVDRVVAPVLVTIKGTAFTAGEPVSVQAGFYELDKRGILNHAVGIDSIPVANLAIKVRANNRYLADFTTDSQGKINLVKSWADFGLMSPKAGNVVNLEWSGSYKGQAFTRLSRVQVR